MNTAEKFKQLVDHYELEAVLECIYDMGRDNPYVMFTLDEVIDDVFDYFVEEDKFWRDAYFDEDGRLMLHSDDIEVQSRSAKKSKK